MVRVSLTCALYRVSYRIILCPTGGVPAPVLAPLGPQTLTADSHIHTYKQMMTFEADSVREAGDRARDSRQRVWQCLQGVVVLQSSSSSYYYYSLADTASRDSRQTLPHCRTLHHRPTHPGLRRSVLLIVLELVLAMAEMAGHVGRAGKLHGDTAACRIRQGAPDLDHRKMGPRAGTGHRRVQMLVSQEHQPGSVDTVCTCMFRNGVSVYSRLKLCEDASMSVEGPQSIATTRALY